MKDMIWNAVRSNVPEGMILPWWALTVRAVLYPLDFFYWRMSKTKGYQWEKDTWLIEGVTYSRSALRLLSKATGETYRVTRTVDTLTLERLPPAEQAESDRLMHQEIDQLRKDAERYRWLRDRYAAADFQWGEHNECVLVFEWPEECSVSGSCDATIDAAMLKTPALAQRANSRFAGPETDREKSMMNEKQPRAVQNDFPAVWDLVIKDMHDRDNCRLGIPQR